MATSSQWLEGARIRTLPAAVSPVLAGSGIAAFEGAFSVPLALLCLLVALALQIGVNYANDYSDGIRGTDADRVGPMRLVGSGAASPGSVKAAAFACFGVAALAGLGLIVLTQLWWLLAVGVAAIAAAWFYTGGKHPYGYLGLGELFVFVFFGLVAVGGTVLVQAGRTTPATWAAAVTIGALACAILVANNLRDLHGDIAAGKRTLATRLGDRGTRWFFVALVVVALAGVVIVALLTTGWALLGLLAVVLLAGPAREVLAGGAGRALITVLKLVGLAELVAAAGLALGLAIGG
ncbi:MAG: 1,4-dihydroxy-2-naphthoate polyprenyltransferase [Micropruina sp.]|uniref:1,4-dihydroxy-2-naphthoate polyprenyltransferase n=1 Tax=Micropruina sp. TaxID=2737536 RepID=UPI0039E52044